MNTHLKCSKVLKIKIFRKLKNTLAKQARFFIGRDLFQMQRCQQNNTLCVLLLINLKNDTC